MRIIRRNGLLINRVVGQTANTTRRTLSNGNLRSPSRVCVPPRRLHDTQPVWCCRSAGRRVALMPDQAAQASLEGCL